MSKLQEKLSKVLNEKDVENSYRSELLTLEGSSIVSPHGGDGLLTAKNIRTLLEFKYDDQLKNKLSQCNILIQCLYYLKKYEDVGDKLPTTIFVGDTDECFAIHSNSIIKYLSSEIDWKIAPSEAHKKNPELIKAMVNDVNILPFVYDINNEFTIKTVLDKLKDFSQNVVRKVRVTKNNIVSIFDYFDKNVLGKVKLTTNQKVNLFIQIIINPGENYLHPKKKNTLITSAYGEVVINQNLYNSFFKHFEGDVYSPKEKEELTGLIDRLVEDTVRRNKGEFFTPTPFVNLTHKYISETFGEDWRERFVVWDSCWGTGNLTRDYRFKELYCSTLEQSDLDTANQMGYNPEATKFRFDFLNDPDSKLPVGLQEVIKSGKEILFFINPPYATAGNMGTKEDDHKGGVAKTMIREKMKNDGWGASTQNLYAQFLYRIFKYQEKNKNVRIALFSPPLFLSGGSYKKFREKFFSKFGFEKGFLFEALHFSDVSKGWGVSFTLFNSGVNDKSEYNLDIVDYNETFGLEVKGKKLIYNTDNTLKATDWVKSKTKNKTKTFTKKSSLNIGNKEKLISEGSFSELIISGNNCASNKMQVYFLNKPPNNENSQSVCEDNFLKTTGLFTARKTVYVNWVNQKDEYLAPNEQHPQYEQFTYDSIVYSLFNNSSQQSSLRQVEYKDKLWDIKNEFFWLSKDEVLNLAEQYYYDEIYKDARTSDDRFVYKKLFQEGIYDKLSPDAKEVLDTATDLLKKSFEMRKLISENHPEYHLNSWDAGYAQLKLVWEEYFKDEFNEFRAKYKKFEGRLRPLVYELGFLKQ